MLTTKLTIWNCTEWAATSLARALVCIVPTTTAIQLSARNSTQMSNNSRLLPRYIGKQHDKHAYMCKDCSSNAHQRCESSLLQSRFESVDSTLKSTANRNNTPHICQDAVFHHARHKRKTFQIRYWARACTRACARSTHIRTIDSFGFLNPNCFRTVGMLAGCMSNMLCRRCLHSFAWCLVVCCDALISFTTVKRLSFVKWHYFAASNPSVNWFLSTRVLSKRCFSSYCARGNWDLDPFAWQQAVAFYAVGLHVTQLSYRVFDKMVLLNRCVPC